MKANQDELKIQIHLTEYQKLREELMYFQNSLQHNVLLALGSASVAIPIILGQTANIPTTIIAILLYALAIVYAVIGMNYAYASYAIGLIGKYIHEHLEPAINREIKTPSKYKVLYWETFVRKERGGFPDILLAGMETIGSMALLLLPGAIALFTSQYVLLVPAIQPTQQNTTIQYISFWLLPISIIAWIAYLLMIAAFILVVIYHPIKTKSAVIE